MVTYRKFENLYKDLITAGFKIISLDSLLKEEDYPEENDLKPYLRADKFDEKGELMGKLYIHYELVDLSEDMKIRKSRWSVLGCTTNIGANETYLEEIAAERIAEGLPTQK